MFLDLDIVGDGDWFLLFFVLGLRFLVLDWGVLWCCIGLFLLLLFLCRKDLGGEVRGVVGGWFGVVVVLLGLLGLGLILCIIVFGFGL